MDEQVKKALAKWPNVPACYDWLGLDMRGYWYILNQKNLSHIESIIQNKALIDFINRNYLADDQGQWFFQNGPQRVYVELAATPWIARINSNSISKVKRGGEDEATKTVQIVRQGAEDEANNVSRMKWNWNHKDCEWQLHTGEIINTVEKIIWCDGPQDDFTDSLANRLLLVTRGIPVLIDDRDTLAVLTHLHWNEQAITEELLNNWLTSNKGELYFDNIPIQRMLSIDLESHFSYIRHPRLQAND